MVKIPSPLAVIKSAAVVVGDIGALLLSIGAMIVVSMFFAFVMVVMSVMLLGVVGYIFLRHGRAGVRMFIAGFSAGCRAEWTTRRKHP